MTTKAKGKGKGKGKTAPTAEENTLEKGSDPRTPEEKAKVKCRFFGESTTCKFGDKCHYSHDADALSDKATKPKDHNNKDPNNSANKTSGG